MFLTLKQASAYYSTFVYNSFMFMVFFFPSTIQKCTVGRKKKVTLPVNSNTNHRREMKLVPINMDYCLFQVDALKFFLGIHLHGRGPVSLVFFSVNSQI